MCWAQAQESVANFASAYSLGKTESAAALNLLNKIPKAIKDKLASLVRTAFKRFKVLLGFVSGLCCFELQVFQSVSNNQYW